MLHRQVTADTTVSSGPVSAGDLLAINIRQANIDEETVGGCPHASSGPCEAAADGRVVDELR